MPILYLKSHSIDIQSELELLAKNNAYEPADIGSLVKRIVLYALENTQQFEVSEMLNLKGKEISSKTADVVYQFEVQADVRQRLIDWAKQRIDGKVKELLEKQVRYILIVYISKEMNDHFKSIPSLPTKK